MIAFGDPGAAVACAVALQRSLAAPDPDLGAPLRVRMGLHVGEAIRFAGDFHGRTVVLAARIGARAGAEEILVSEAVVRRVAHSMRGHLTRLGDVALKGLAGRHAIYTLDWKPRARADRRAAIAPPATV
jgi:adenylate cyclase